MKRFLPFVVLALMSIGGHPSFAEEPEMLQTCPSGQGTTVVKTAGSCSGTSCPMACKRTVCVPNKWWARKSQLDPLCNPISGANCYFTVWRYEVKTSITATNVCPAEINGATYQAP